MFVFPGKRYECIVARLGFNDLSTEAENLSYDQVTFKDQFKGMIECLDTEVLV